MTCFARKFVAKRGFVYDDEEDDYLLTSTFDNLFLPIYLRTAFLICLRINV